VKTFIVHTHEDVTGTYRVQAESQEAAEDLFKDKTTLLRNWDRPERVEQVDYQAFTIEVDTVEEVS